MADVRSGVGAATTGVFTGPVGMQVGTPVYIDLSTGDMSFLLAGDVIYTINLASFVMATQAFNRHVVPAPTDLGDAGTQLANRALSRGYSPPPPVYNTNEQLGAQVFARHNQPAPNDVGDANMHLAVRGMDRGYFPPPPVSNTNESLGTQIFAKREQAAVIGDANDLIRSQSFSPRPYAAPMSFPASTVLESRSMRTAQLPPMWT